MSTGTARSDDLEAGFQGMIDFHTESSSRDITPITESTPLIRNPRLRPRINDLEQQAGEEIRGTCDNNGGVAGVVVGVFVLALIVRISAAVWLDK